VRALIDGFDLNMPIGFARAGAEFEAIADFAFNFLDYFLTGEGADFDVTDVAAVVLSEPASGKAFDTTGETH
jgi:hypothetical protein